MQNITDSLLASTDKMLKGLTDVAGSTNAVETDLNKGAEGTLKTAAAKPEAAVLVEEAENKAQKLKAAKAEAAAKAAEAETPAEVQHDDEKVELADVEESAPESV